VPGQQRGWGDEAVQTQLTGEQAGQGGQDCPVWPGGTRSDLTAQHRDFVTEDQDFDVLSSGGAGEQPKPAEHRDRDQIQESK
jgi:hypothetical protein